MSENFEELEVEYQRRLFAQVDFDDLDTVVRRRRPLLDTVVQRRRPLLDTVVRRRRPLFLSSTSTSTRFSASDASPSGLRPQPSAFDQLGDFISALDPSHSRTQTQLTKAQTLCNAQRKDRGDPESPVRTCAQALLASHIASLRILKQSTVILSTTKIRAPIPSERPSRNACRRCWIGRGV
jgi:hypothetical protein